MGCSGFWFCCWFDQYSASSAMVPAGERGTLDSSVLRVHLFRCNCFGAFTRVKLPANRSRGHSPTPRRPSAPPTPHRCLQRSPVEERLVFGQITPGAKVGAKVRAGGRGGRSSRGVLRGEIGDRQRRGRRKAFALFAEGRQSAALERRDEQRHVPQALGKPVLREGAAALRRVACVLLEHHLVEGEQRVHVTVSDRQLPLRRRAALSQSLDSNRAAVLPSFRASQAGLCF